MSRPQFEDSFGGDAGKISPETRLECKICWHVYDPECGDSAWQIPPGTPFSDLPDDWSCPNCDASKSGFMVVKDA
jgi:rubredoxin